MMGIVDGVVEGGSERARCVCGCDCDGSRCCCVLDADAVLDILFTLDALAERCATSFAG